MKTYNMSSDSVFTLFIVLKSLMQNPSVVKLARANITPRKLLYLSPWAIAYAFNVVITATISNCQRRNEDFISKRLKM